MHLNNKLIFTTRVLLLSLLMFLVASCNRGDAYILVPQHWNEDEILVEIRPGAPQKGMNEFVLVATNYKTGVPGY